MYALKCFEFMVCAGQLSWTYHLTSHQCDIAAAITLMFVSRASLIMLRASILHLAGFSRSNTERAKF